MRAWLVLLAACGADDPCDGTATACVTVHVTAEAISAIDTLELDIAYPGFHATAKTTGAVTELPLATAVELGGITDAVAVDIVGAGKLAGAVLGTGYERTAPLAAGDHVALELALARIADPCVLGTYCGGDKIDGAGDTLYLCHPGGLDDPDGDPEANVPTLRGVCANGCIRNTDDDDLCSGGNLACTDGNTYCGGNKLDGDPQILYRCVAGGTPVVVEDCEQAGMRCATVTADSDACR